MKDNLTKHYDKFTAKERINLAIAAMARQDHEELSRLGKTCPQKEYTATDENYCGVIDQLYRVGIGYNCHCHNILNEITAYQAIITMRRTNFINYERGIFDAISDPSNDNPIWQKLDKKLNDCLESINKSEQKIKETWAKLKAVDEALKQFCGEIGVDFNNTRLWFTTGKAEYINTDIVLDNNLIAEVKKDFCEFWNK